MLLDAFALTGLIGVDGGAQTALVRDLHPPQRAHDTTP